ncbi:MAG: prepilin-type N-terminal cleavage/methylation domain-containing protein [bacterium]|nr:prepilin-type N-terminal cleavage/methylation domain-containing protein [bacterium]
MNKYFKKIFSTPRLPITGHWSLFIPSSLNSRTNHENHRKNGFTLLEVLISLTISVVVATVITLVTASGLKNVRAARRMERVHANITYTADALTYWIKQAKLAQTPSAGTLELVVPAATSYKTVILQKNGSQITLDGNAITSNDVEIADLTFTRFPKSVRIGLTIQSAYDTAQSLSVTTTVTQRNSF